MRAYAEYPIEDQGSVVTFHGFDNDDAEPIVFAADHRMAQAIVDYIDQYDEPCPVELESWQVLGRG